MQLTSSQLVEFIKDTLLVECEVDDHSKLFSTGEIDSASMLQLIVFIESKTGIEVRPDDVTLENFDSVENMLRFVHGKK